MCRKGIYEPVSYTHLKRICTLPTDRLVKAIALNTGNGFDEPISWKGANALSESASTSESANAAFTLTINIPVISIKISTNPGAVSYTHLDVYKRQVYSYVLSVDTVAGKVKGETIARGTFFGDTHRITNLAPGAYALSVSQGGGNEIYATGNALYTSYSHDTRTYLSGDISWTCLLYTSRCV